MPAQPASAHFGARARNPRGPPFSSRRPFADRLRRRGGHPPRVGQEPRRQRPAFERDDRVVSQAAGIVAAHPHQHPAGRSVPDQPGEPSSGARSSASIVSRTPRSRLAAAPPTRRAGPAFAGCRASRSARHRERGSHTERVGTRSRRTRNEKRSRRANVRLSPQNLAPITGLCLRGNASVAGSDRQAWSDGC